MKSSSATATMLKGTGCLLLIIFLCLLTWVVVPTIDRLIIVLAYGWEEYENGLHIVESKPAILSNGSRLPLIWRHARAGLFIGFLVLLGLGIYVTHCIERVIFGGRTEIGDTKEGYLRFEGITTRTFFPRRIEGVIKTTDPENAENYLIKQGLMRIKLEEATVDNYGEMYELIVMDAGVREANFEYRGNIYKGDSLSCYYLTPDNRKEMVFINLFYECGCRYFTVKDSNRNRLFRIDLRNIVNIRHSGFITKKLEITADDGICSFSGGRLRPFLRYFEFECNRAQAQSPESREVNSSRRGKDLSSCAYSTHKNLCTLALESSLNLRIDDKGRCVDEDNCPEYTEDIGNR